MCDSEMWLSARWGVGSALCLIPGVYADCSCSMNATLLIYGVPSVRGLHAITSCVFGLTRIFGNAQLGCTIPEPESNRFRRASDYFLW